MLLPLKYLKMFIKIIATFHSIIWIDRKYFWNSTTLQPPTVRISIHTPTFEIECKTFQTMEIKIKQVSNENI